MLPETMLPQYCCLQSLATASMFTWALLLHSRKVLSLASVVMGQNSFSLGNLTEFYFIASYHRLLITGLFMEKQRKENNEINVERKSRPPLPQAQLYFLPLG